MGLGRRSSCGASHLPPAPVRERDRLGECVCAVLYCIRTIVPLRTYCGATRVARPRPSPRCAGRGAVARELSWPWWMPWGAAVSLAERTRQRRQHGTRLRAARPPGPVEAIQVRRWWTATDIRDVGVSHVVSGEPPLHMQAKRTEIRSASYSVAGCVIPFFVL